MPGASGVTGRSPASGSTMIKAQALRVMSSGGRPASIAAAVIRSLSSANPSAELPYQSYQVFHASTCGIVIANMRGPFEPIISGTCRPGTGSRTASSAWQNSPC